MSRIGKRPVVIPAGVTVESVNGVLTVTGKKGRLSRPIPEKVAVEVKGGTATVVLLDEDAGNLYGMYRTILANMVQGVTDGFLRILEIVGVGYKAESRGDALHLALGYSHRSFSRCRRA
jgi:large subunit ribosomal protein L6